MEKALDTRFDTWMKRAQRIVWILLGIGIAIHQTLYASDPNPLLIGLAGLCLGLPVTLGMERKKPD